MYCSFILSLCRGDKLSLVELFFCGPMSMRRSSEEATGPQEEKEI